MLPDTAHPDKGLLRDPGWIVKPALGRVGEDIPIRGAASDKEIVQFYKNAMRRPKQWIAQRLFRSKPLESVDGPYHLCVGVFTVDGKYAGLYGRMSPSPRIDATAMDVPVLVAHEDKITSEGGGNDRQSGSL